MSDILHSSAAFTALRVGPHRPVLPVVIGTRTSPLALAQSRSFTALLSRYCPVLDDGMNVFQERGIRTTGDATQASGQRLADIGGKGLFAKEIHEALLDRRVDMAVHSLKDLETVLPPGIVLACTMVREDPRDALILCLETEAAEPGACPFPALPHGALVGTSSVRRQAQLLAMRPDLRVATIRGNVHSRLDKVRRGDFAASLLAVAGLRRLDIAHEADEVIDADTMVPAACQGIVGITVRENDAELRHLLAAISDSDADCAAAAERGILGALDGSCTTPIGAHARILDGGRLHLTGLVARPDGSFLLRRSLVCGRSDAARAGTALGEELRRDSPADVFL